MWENLEPLGVSSVRRGYYDYNGAFKPQTLPPEFYDVAVDEPLNMDFDLKRKCLDHDGKECGAPMWSSG